MQFATWEPIYQLILEDFGFSRDRDEEAAELLAGILREHGPMLQAAKAIVIGQSAVVCGNAPNLDKELKDLHERDAVFLAADGATAVLLEHNIAVRCPACITSEGLQMAIDVYFWPRSWARPVLSWWALTLRMKASRRAKRENWSGPKS
jgi:hypothetical protein